MLGAVLYCDPVANRFTEVILPNPLTTAIPSAGIPLGPDGDEAVTLGGLAVV